MGDWLSALIGMGGGIASGIFGNRPQTTDTTYSGTQTGRQQGQSSTTRDLLPEQSAMLGPLLQQILQQINNPGAALQPFQTAAREQVNSNYAAVPDAIRAKYGNGGNASGKSGKAARVAEVARAGDLSGLEGQFAQAKLGLQNSGLTLAERLLGQSFGSTTNTDSNTNYANSGTQRQVKSGNAAGGGIAGGLGGFFGMGGMGLLQHLLGGGGSGSGPSYYNPLSGGDGGEG